ncbi:MAG: PEP-CTERM sorting domain-containing protein [Phycisphaerales bacterium]
MNMKLKVALVMIMMSLAVSSQAGGLYWSANSGDWASGSSWDVGSKPGAGDQALVLWDHTITVTGNEQAGTVNLGYVANGWLNIAAGGSLNVGTMHVGQTDEGNLEVGTMNVNGTVTAQTLYVAFERNNGRGVLNVNNGGLVTVNEGFYMSTTNTTEVDAFARINLNGNGSIISNWGYAVQLQNAKAHIDLEAGFLKFKGDQRAQIETYINSGWLTAYDGNGTVNAPVFDGVNTIVTAIPEPATMILLSIGGLLLRRKMA